MAKRLLNLGFVAGMGNTRKRGFFLRTFAVICLILALFFFIVPENALAGTAAASDIMPKPGC